MNIALDAGALCVPEEMYLGTSVFTRSFLDAVGAHDDRNNYTAYAFCNINKIARNVQSRRIWPRAGFMKFGISKEELLNPSDLFLALNQAVPFYTHASIISFCHGLSYCLYPKHYPESYNKFIDQLSQMVSRSRCIVTSSVKVTRELKKMYPNLDLDIISIPFGVPTDFLSYERRARKNYFLYIGSSASIKRVDYIVSCFRELAKLEKFKKYELYLVGPHENHSDSNVRAFNALRRSQIKKLCQEAACYVSASYYESFNFPIIEALSQNCPVVAMKSAVIDELRPYTMTASSKTEFIHLLAQTGSSKINYNYSNQVKQVFSFKNFVKRLMSLYETISYSSHQKRRK